jgi:signal peptidase I
MSINAYCKGEKDIENTSISSGIDPREALIPGHSLCVKCRGQSMYPMIKGGDTLLIEVVNANKLKPGDIAFYCLPSGTFVVHRLVKRNGAGLLLTNGDNLRQADNPVTGEHIFGKVTVIERGGKSLALTGTLSKITGWVISFLARYRLPLQITLKRNLGRLHWLIGGRRIV